MTTKPDKGFHFLTLIRRLGRIGITMFAGAFLTVLVSFIIFMQQHQDLRVWHTADLDEEYTTEKQVTGFAGYLALEDRLFSQLEAEIYDKIPLDERQLLNRYSRGSLSDPAQWANNWNRSFEFTVPKPVAGVLLLHGLSDSPYSLRKMGQKLSASGAYVLGLRIPGHGTAPSGLVKIKWEDMAGAVRLAMGHLKKQFGDIPLYIVGYSNGGALAVQYILSTLKNISLPRASGVVLISPEIGVAKVAALAVWQDRIGRLLGLPKLAWNSVLPEYDPFKYNSFAVNAGSQAYRLTTEIQNQITRHTKSGVLSQLPPIMAFQSVVDATVRVSALIKGLFDRLPQGDHELVLFDVNRLATNDPLVDTGPRDKIAALLDKPMLSYRLSLVSNESTSTRKVAVYQKYTGSSEKSVFPLSLAWPAGVYSLSHVALPFSPDDPLYGGDDAGESPGIQLGNVVLRGEDGVLRVNPASLLRMHWNPFYDYLEHRVLQFMALRASE